ncbi:hypothetical protein A3D14_02100 [Candidatus Saccharibacteria bacterium RIFCSPHIGHO2_02_FULL_47_12]|nr:MAG: hypothetical protein A3D14_02100 [Candidatus Saccharibacteria bacterium RIFCSPHIGHO2_02_FULL_47_12]
MAFWNKHKKVAVGQVVSKLQMEQVKSDIIINSIDDGVVLIDAQKIIRLFNPAASKMTGWNQNEALGLDYKSIMRLVDEKNNPYREDQDPFNRAFTEASPVRDNQAVLVSRSEKFLSVTVSVSPLLDENKAVIGVVGIFRDVSEERTQERQRAEFISTASHEMRTPVAAIEGYLALAMNDNVSKIDSKARGFLEKAHASTKALGDLFQDLLTSAKAEDGRLSNHPQVLEMDQYLEQLTQDLRFAAEKKALTVEYMVGSGGAGTGLIDARDGNSKVIAPIYYVYADPDRLREVITNLFDNSVKYTDSGKITIGLTGNNQVVQLYIKDTGAGIPAEDIPHLFEKFYRVDNSATRTVGGTGLGLFICRKIIEMYHGRIWTESELGKGSTFYINLPRLEANKAAQMKANQPTDVLPEIQGATKI